MQQVPLAGGGVKQGPECVLRWHSCAPRGEYPAQGQALRERPCGEIGAVSWCDVWFGVTSFSFISGMRNFPFIARWALKCEWLPWDRWCSACSHIVLWLWQLVLLTHTLNRLLSTSLLCGVFAIKILYQSRLPPLCFLQCQAQGFTERFGLLSSSAILIVELLISGENPGLDFFLCSPSLAYWLTCSAPRRSVTGGVSPSPMGGTSHNPVWLPGVTIVISND